MTLSYLAHILGFTLWLGGGLAAMLVGITLTEAPFASPFKTAPPA